MKYAIDIRKDQYVVIDKEANRIVTPPYNKELNALKWIKTATKFPRDMYQMDVERLYEKHLKEKIEEELTPPVVNTTETVIFADIDDPIPAVPVIEETKEEELIPWEPMYYCEECKRNHEKTSKIGRNHLKYREVK